MCKNTPSFAAFGLYLHRAGSKIAGMDITIATIAGLITGLVAGIIITKMLLGKSKSPQGENPGELETLQAQLNQEKKRSADLETQRAVAVSQSQALQGQLEQATAQTEKLRQQSADQADQLRINIASVTDENTRIKTELTHAKENIAQQKKLLEDAQSKLSSTFESLSGQALKSNNDAFIKLATTTLEKVLETAKGDIGKKQQAIDTMVKPLAEALGKYETQITNLEKSRVTAYTELRQQVIGLQQQQEQLRKETSNLSTALRKPDVRGRWGEIQLKRVAELSGMIEHCDFEEQVSVKHDAHEKGDASRPDMVVKLPGGREIVVDSKVALDGYLSAIEASDETERDQQLTRHARHINEHVRQLSAKAYWDRFENSPEFVVMFIPGDFFLAAALDKDHTLIERAMENRVIIATPTTLVALLRAVAYGWRQEQIAENARKISQLGKELYDRIKTTSAKFVTLGTRLSSATKAYNETMGSLERRVLPTARKFKDLGIAAADDKGIDQLAQVELTPRELTAPEFATEQESPAKLKGSGNSQDSYQSADAEK